MLPLFKGQLLALQHSPAANLWPSQHIRRMEQLQHVCCAASKASSKAKTVYRCSECGSGEWGSWHAKHMRTCISFVHAASLGTC
jgi:hypothetical protein